MMRWAVVFGVIYAAMVGCAAREASDTAASPSYAEEPAMANMMGRATQEAAQSSVTDMGIVAQGTMAGGAMAPPQGQPPNLAQVQNSAPDRYLIKNGGITLEVKDARETARKVSEAAVAVGGYTANRTETLPSVGHRQVTMQVRVPAPQFDTVIDQLAGFGKVIQQTVNTQEVTEEFVDTDARVRNLKMTEQRVLGHLERATDLAEILNLERELTRIRGEIEGMDGRLRYLKSRVDFSSIDVTLAEEAQAQSVLPVRSWSLGKEFADAARSLGSLLQGLLSIAAWLIVWAIIWLPLAWVALLVARRIRKDRQRNLPPPTPPAP